MGHVRQPLAEVFGHLIIDHTEEAVRYRSRRLCPFNNKVPNCTKDKANDPLGVCSVYHENHPVITCPIRFREKWIITDDAASFIADPQARATMDWSDKPNYPRPDYLSSSRKRLAPQLLFKGGILHSWKKKIAVALDKSFFATLPSLQRVNKSDADIAWFIYDLELTKGTGAHPGRYSLKKVDEVFTEFEPTLNSITTPSPGKVEDFIKLLQEKLDEQIETPPVNNTIERPF